MISVHKSMSTARFQDVTPARSSPRRRGFATTPLQPTVSISGEMPERLQQQGKAMIHSPGRDGKAQATRTLPADRQQFAQSAFLPVPAETATADASTLASMVD